MAIAWGELPGQDGRQVRPVLSGARVALAGLAGCDPERVWTLSDQEVRAAGEALGQVVMAAQGALVAVLAQARHRGISTSGGWGGLDWARSVAPMLPERMLRDVEVVAAAVEEPRLQGVVEAVAEGVRASDLEVRPLPVGKAAQVVRFHAGVRGLADPADLEGATATLVESGRGAEGLSERDLAVAVRYAADLLRPDPMVEDEAAARRAMRSLVKGVGSLGMSRYTLLLDEEGSAVMDAAVDALAKPLPDPDTGARDVRTPAARRADALLELVGRPVSAPDGVPRQAKTALVVTMGMDVLAGRCRGAGLTSAGEMLTAGVVRRLACDADLVPMVLGSAGEVLDQGQAVRLFTPGQLRHLGRRDQGCTFPGCSRPATWADAHHLIHWADGGPTDIANAALLCRAHHSVVHARSYAGRLLIGPGGPRVVWDLTDGSYQRHLHHWRSQRDHAAQSTGDRDRQRDRHRQRDRDQQRDDPCEGGSPGPRPAHFSAPHRRVASTPCGCAPATACDGGHVQRRLTTWETGVR